VRAAGCCALALAVAVAAGCGSSNRLTATSKELRKSGPPVLSIAWPATNLLAVGGTDEVELRWAKGERFQLLPVKGQVWGVGWSKGGSRLAAAVDTGDVYLWDQRAEPLGVLRAKHGIAFSVSWSPSDYELLVGYEDGTVIRWSTDRRKPIAVWHPHTAEVIAVAWSPNGKLLASGSIDTSVRVRDDVSGRQVAVLEDQGSADVNGLAWSPDSRLLAAANQDGLVRIWDPAHEKVVARLRRFTGWARGVGWSPDGKLVAASGEDGRVRIWDPKSQKRELVLRADRAPAWSAAWSEVGKRLVAGTDSGRVESWTFR